MRLLDCKILRKLLNLRFDRYSHDNQTESSAVKKQLCEAYKALLETPAGEIVLDDLLNISGVGTDPIVAGDNQQTMANIGAQRLGLRILSMIGTDINQYVVIEKEIRDEKRQENRAEGVPRVL